MENTKSPKGSAAQPSQMRRLWDMIILAKPEKGRLALSGLLAIAGELLGLVPFLVIYMVIAEWSRAPAGLMDQAQIYLWVAYAGVAVVGKHLCLCISTCLSHVSAFNILYNLRMALARKLRRIPLGYFSRENSGQIKKIISEDVEQLEIFLAHQVPDFLSAFFYPLVTMVVLFVIDWRLALAAILVIPLGLSVQVFGFRGSAEASRQWNESKGAMNAAMVEYIQGMPVIKAFNHTVKSFSKYFNSVTGCFNLENQMGKRWFFPMAVFTVSLTGNLLFLLPVGSWLYSAGLVSLQKFVFFLLVGIGIGNPTWLLMQAGRYTEQNLEILARINDLLASQELEEPAQPGVAEEPVRGQGVGFAYEGDRLVLRGVDFEVPAGKFIAVVGPSGAGKTTLIRLIPRYWDVTRGAIYLGPSDLRDLGMDQVMDKFSPIFQQVHLFNDTVRANLKIGRPGASDREMIEVAKKAQCHDFIMNLPQGYDTVVGERGARISGGEKQRLSIARALLKDAPILILDEATAYIDPENENLVQSAINAMVAHKTLIVIAHHLSTVVNADEIWLMDQGEIVARGTHQRLLADNALYQHLWNTHLASQGWVLEGAK